MSDTIDYIDDYFTGALSIDERKKFEARCSNDEDFAAEVAFYITARQGVRDVLLEKKKEHWTQPDDTDGDMRITKPAKKRSVGVWLSYIAAACLLFIVAGYFLFYQTTPKQLAEKYIGSETLSQTMDASHDSLQAGIAEMQAGNYRKALAIFEDMQSRDVNNDDAKKYAGLTYLRIHNFDKALERFRELSSITGLQSNSGDILQAETLLMRDAPGDQIAAKVLLEKVVREDAEGSKEAKEILDNW